jgi:predicted Zn-dependent peptidase
LGAVAGTDIALDHTIQFAVVQPDRLKDAIALQAAILAEPDTASSGGTAANFRSSICGQSIGFEPDACRSISELDSPADATEPRAVGLARIKSLALGHQIDSLDTGRAPGVASDNLADFYRGHYTPDKLIICVVGDVLTFATLVEIQRLYANFGMTKPAIEGRESAQPAANATPASTGAHKEANGATAPVGPKPTSVAESQQSASAQPSEKSSTVVTQNRLHYEVAYGDVAQPVVTVGFRTPGYGSKSWPAFEVLAALMGKGKASRLHHLLVDGSKAATAARVEYRGYADSGLLAIQIEPGIDPKSGSLIDRAESTLFREIESARRELVPEAELRRAKSLLEKRFLDRTERYLENAIALAGAEDAGGFRLAMDYRSLILAVRPEEVRQAAASCFGIASANVHEFLPRTGASRTFDSESFAATVLAWAPTLAQPVDPKKLPGPPDSAPAAVTQGTERSAEDLSALESLEPLPIKDFSTLNGPRAFVREDHSRPKVTIAVLFMGGRIAEDSARSGITDLMLRSMLGGTSRTSSADLNRELEQLGAEVTPVVEPDFFGFMAETLSRNADRTLRVIRELVEDPAFKKESLDAARSAQLASLRSGLSSAAEKARALLYQSLFANHPYAVPAEGREQSVEAITPEQIQEWYEATVKRQIPLAVIVGDTDGSALVSGTIAEGFRRRDVDKTMHLPIPQSNKPEEKVEQRAIPVTVMATGFPGPKGGDGDLVSIELIAAAMNGQDGGLFRALTDKRANAFYAQLDSTALLTSGAIQLLAAIPPTDEQAARAGMLSALDAIGGKGLTENDLDEARELALTLRRMRLQSQASRALEYARAFFFKTEPSEVDSFADRSSKISTAELKRVAGKYLKPSAASTVIERGTPPSPPKAPSQQD